MILLKFTIVEILNVLILQWFCIRLTRCTDTKTEWYTIQGFILPWTGWSDEFIFLSKGPIHYRITSKKEVA